MKAMVCAVLVVTAALFAPLEGIGADPDWVLIDESEESSFFYDRNGITKLAERVVQVRTRVVYTELGRKEAVKVLRDLPEPNRLYESRYIHRINCPESEGRPILSTHFDSKGSILKSTDLDPVSSNEYLPPDTRMGVVVAAACGS